MNNNRLPKTIFNWDYSCRGNTWSSNIKSIFDDIDCQNEFISKSQVSMNSCWALFLHELQWLDYVIKLGNQNYVHISLLKNSYEVEPYALSFINRKHRSYLVQFHCGIVPLSIETGRWASIPLEDRICKMCNSLVVEDEYHFICHCSLK